MPTETPQLVCVDPARVPKIWPHVAHLVRRAMERGGVGDFGAVEASVRKIVSIILALSGKGRKLAKCDTE